MKRCAYPITFDVHGDGRGALVALEAGSQVPFDVKRVYYLYDVPAGQSRGYHAHRKLEQVLVCVHGSVRLTVDDGTSREEVLLDDPARGLYVGPGMWREMRDFADGAVLLVLASRHYEEEDYIRDYDAFLKSVRAEGCSER